MNNPFLDVIRLTDDGWHENDIAAHLGIPPEQVPRALSSRSALDARELLRLARVFGSEIGFAALHSKCIDYLNSALDSDDLSIDDLVCIAEVVFSVSPLDRDFSQRIA